MTKIEAEEVYHMMKGYLKSKYQIKTERWGPQALMTRAFSKFFNNVQI